METLADEMLSRVHRLMDEHRLRCLWFLRRDYYPATRTEALQMLNHIAKHGDLATFRAVGALRTCLSVNSSEPSVG